METLEVGPLEPAEVHERQENGSVICNAAAIKKHYPELYAQLAVRVQDADGGPESDWPEWTHRGYGLEPKEQLELVGQIIETQEDALYAVVSDEAGPGGMNLAGYLLASRHQLEELSSWPPTF